MLTCPLGSVPSSNTICLCDCSTATSFCWCSSEPTPLPENLFFSKRSCFNKFSGKFLSLTQRNITQQVNERSGFCNSFVKSRYISAFGKLLPKSVLVVSIHTTRKRVGPWNLSGDIFHIFNTFFFIVGAVSRDWLWGLEPCTHMLQCSNWRPLAWAANT